MLRKIELYNFKSYQGHHVIGPFTWFTSIIGPNGSGKSNLMDAISFVLGVQSSNLRSAQLKELIHSGCTSAWVMAIYEKNDTETIEFKRSITASGSSDYRINGSVVSAADYNKTWAEENVLVKARNFMVFQGDVQNVAAQSPKDLTKLIEQVSGSIDLKAEFDELKHKYETSAELATVSFNRRRGFKGEKRRYQNQKVENERHAILVDKKEALVQRLALWKLFHMDRQIYQEEMDKIELESAGRSLKQRLKTAEVAMRKAKKKYSLEMRSLVQEEEQILDLQNRKAALQPKLLNAKEKMCQLQSETTQLQSSVDALNAEERSKEREMDRLNQELGEVKERSEDFEERAKQEAAKRGIQLSPAQQELYDQANARAIGVTLPLTQQLDDLRRRRSNEEEKLTNVQEVLEEARNRVAQLEQQKTDLSTRQASVENARLKLEEVRSEVSASLNRLNLDKLAARNQETTANDKLSSILANISEAKSDKIQAEKQEQMEESLAALTRIFPGVQGRVSDLCRPVQRKFDMAISVIMGKNIDAIVVDKESTAMDCIQYLKEQRLGPATIIPLDTVRVNVPNPNYRSFAGARLAVDCLEYNRPFEKAMLYCCGDALICENMDVAKDLCYKQHVHVKAVTLDGTIFHKSGLITGGTVEAMRSRAKRWQQRELQTWLKKRDLILRDMEHFKVRQREISRDQEPLTSKLAEHNTRIASHDADLKSIEQSLLEVDDKLKKARSQVRLNQPKVEDFSGQIEKTKSRMAQVEEQLDAANAKIYAEFCQAVGVTDIRQFKDLEQSHQKQIAQKRMRFSAHVSKLQEKLKYDQGKLAELRDKRLGIQEDLKKRQAEVDRIGSSEMQGLASESDDIEADLAKRSAEFDGRKAELEKLHAQMLEARDDRRKVEKEDSQHVQALSSAAVRIERLHGERYFLLRKCNVEGIEVPLSKGSVTEDTEGPITGITNDDTPMADVGGKITINYDELPAALKKVSLHYSLRLDGGPLLTGRTLV